MQTRSVIASAAPNAQHPPQPAWSRTSKTEAQMPPHFSRASKLTGSELMISSGGAAWTGRVMFEARSPHKRATSRCLAPRNLDEGSARKLPFAPLIWRMRAAVITGSFSALAAKPSSCQTASTTALFIRRSNAGCGFEWTGTRAALVHWQSRAVPACKPAAPAAPAPQPLGSAEPSSLGLRPARSLGRARYARPGALHDVVLVGQYMILYSG